jgi:hypothetical protein
MNEIEKDNLRSRESLNKRTEIDAILGLLAKNVPE